MICSNFANSEGEGTKKSFRLIALNSVISRPKIESSSVYHQKNKWNLDVKTNFENFDFCVLSTTAIAFILMNTHHLQISNMNLYSEFTK